MAISILDHLEESAAIFPDKPAYVDENRAISYKETRLIARKIASSLLASGAEKESVVVFMDKSVESLATFFGIAYSGCFYSVIDIDMPIQRINKILETLQPRFAITKKRHTDLLAKTSFEGTALTVEDCESAVTNESAVDVAKNAIIDTDLLYVLFTSGSTGVPKGVTIRHFSFADYAERVVDIFGFDESLRIANQAPFYFDHSHFDIYASLRAGGTMFIIPQKLCSYPVKLLQYLVDNEINCIFWVPTLLCSVVNLRAISRIHVPTLTKIMFGGEVMPVKQLNAWRKEYPEALFANLYGPTEITDACTYYIVNREFDDTDSLPIGKPFANTSILVLDENNNLIIPSQIGAIGELCVRGSSLSCGYFNNWEKTREAFVQNPLNCAYPELIYRTGDLVSYNEHGEIEYHARKDHQIKRSGHRIELGEIEAAAGSLSAISQCCCAFIKDTERLVLFYSGACEEGELDAGLRSILQDYMIPNTYHYMDSLPLNANGKIDRTTLQARAEELVGRKR